MAVHNSDKSFLYGATILGHTVEGENFASDWWRWEQRPGRIAGSATSQTAADHWNRFPRDVKLASTIGLNCLLVSIEWSRIEPKQGEFDRDALDHYVQVLKAMKKHGITPIVALQAITLPAWFAEAGGWMKDGAAEVFGRYVEETVRTLAPHCQHWIPLYRIVEALEMGYVHRSWPPGRSNVMTLTTVFRQVRDALFAASSTIRANDGHAQIGISTELPDAIPYDEESPWDYRAAQEVNERASSSLFLDEGMLGRLDFLRLRLDPRVELSLGDAIEDAGDEIPDSLHDFWVLPVPGRRWVRFAPTAIRRGCIQALDEHAAPVDPRYRRPDPERLATVTQQLELDGKPVLFVGGAHDFTDDRERCAYILDHLEAIQQLDHTEIDVMGYVHESFLDGFEWDRGYTVRRGIVHVDWETLARTPNQSAYLLGDIARQRGITSGAIRKYCPGWHSKLEPAL